MKNIKEQKKEALERMNTLKLSKQCIKAFEKENKVWLSEGVGALYELNEKEQKIVSEFEKENGGCVYHIIHNIFEFGECYSLLYVSEHKEEWKLDKKDLERNIVFAYVKNVDNESFSEFGSILIKPQIGGLVRIG